MTWELGSEKNLGKLFEYECRLDETLRKYPAISGICQYHTDTIPCERVKEAMYTHEAVYVNDTLSRLNPYYRGPEKLDGRRSQTSPIELGEMLKNLQG